MPGSILGATVRRVEDPRFVTGTGTYLGDMRFEGEAWMAVVRSTVAHAIVTSVDTEAALAMPGVVAIYTAADFDGLRLQSEFTGHKEEMFRPLIPSDRVRFVGDIVAIVVAETQQQALDAADQVWPEYDELAVVVDPMTALDPDAPLLYPETGSNLAISHGQEAASDEPGDDEVIVETDIVQQRMAGLPLEGNSTAAIPGADGRLDVYAGSQRASTVQIAISKTLGLDKKQVRVRVPDMGGGFGPKIPAYPEHVLTAAIALRLGRPVRWEEGRRENLMVMAHGRDQHQHVKAFAGRDGRVRRLELSIVLNAGAYPRFGAELANYTRRMASGPYRIPEIAVESVSVVTNTTPLHAYRGAGRPEATFMLERVMDLVAAELGMDPAEIRRRNFFEPDEFPVVTATGERYDTGNYAAGLDLALATADYPALRREQQRRRDAGDRWQLGIGVSSYVEVTAPGGRKDWGRVDIREDGSATVYSGASSHGHSHETTFVQLASQIIDIPMESIDYVQADTDRIKLGGGTMGSRSMQMAGSAVKRAADAVVAKARAIVAHTLEASLEDIVHFPDGGFGVAGLPDSVMTWGEIAALAADPARLPDGMDPGLTEEDVWIQEEATVPFGSHVSVAEVDTETGDVRLLRHVACDDPGVVFNRMVVDGQVHGGIAQGIGQALYEQVTFDEAGTPLNNNLTSYLLPTGAVIPPIVIDRTETPTDQNPLGVKGIGEAGTIGATPAVVSAVIDALAPLGVRMIQMPLTPSAVWSAIRTANPT